MGGSARYIGRIGALAVALGIGAALGSAPAWADSTGSDSTGSDSAAAESPSAAKPSEPAKSSNATDTPATTPSETTSEPSTGSGTTGSTSQPAPGVTVSSSGGAQTSQKKRPTATTKRKLAPEPVTAHATAQTNTGTHSESTAPDPAPAAAPTPTPAPVTTAPASPQVSSSPNAGSAETAVEAVATAAPSATPGTDIPVQSPAEWVVLAAARREIGGDTEQEPVLAAQTSTAEPLAGAVVNTPPVIAPVTSTTNADTGVVSGKINATDPEKKKLTYTLVAPVAGLVFDTKTAAFTYTPTAAQRVLAGLSPDPVTVSFTVRVSDGVNAVDTTVPVTISKVTVTNNGIFPIGVSGSGLVVSNTRAYVSDSSSSTLTVIDTNTRKVIDTITLDSPAVGTALSLDGKKLYVATATSTSITVINTATNAKLAPIALGVNKYPDLLTVSSDGKTLYALTDDETGDSPVATVTKISTSSGKVTGTVALPGTIVSIDNDDVTSFYSLIVSPDSKKIYVIADLEEESDEGYPLSGLFTFSSTAKTATLVSQGLYYVESALSPDGKRLYVNDVDAEKILVFDTATNAVIGNIANTDGTRGGITLSADGSVLLAVKTDTYQVIAYDTTTAGYPPINAFNAGLPTDGYYPASGFSPDGKEFYYLGDEGNLQILTFAGTGSTRAVPAPVLQTPDPTTGAVSGTVTDATGKKLTYTLVAGPAGGTFTFNKTTGAFTYTPTLAQRVLAGVDPNATAVTFSVTVSDGKTTVPVQVTVPINPVNVSGLGNIGIGDNGWGLALTNTRAYVTQATTNTITVIDTIRNVTLDPIDIGVSGAGIAVTPDGKQLFVTSWLTGEVKVVDTATGLVTKTIALPGKKPLSIAVSTDGKTVYVGSATPNPANINQIAVDANGNPVGATITKISTSTYKVTGTVTNIGTYPTQIVVAPDGKKVYVVSTQYNALLAPESTYVYAFASSATKGTLITNIGNRAYSVALSPDSATLYVAGTDAKLYAVDTKKYTLLKSASTGAATPEAVTTSKDGSVVVVRTVDGKIQTFDAKTLALQSSYDTGTASYGSPYMLRTPDGQRAYTIAGDGVEIVTLVPLNLFPTAHSPNVNDPNSSGVVTGNLTVTDSNGDKLTFSAKPAYGTIVFNADGSFTYTPTAAARHAAAGTGPASETFQVTIDDGRRGILVQDLEVDILPANIDPTGKTTPSKPNSTTGVVTGTVSASDKDKDPLTYTVSAPSHGDVTIDAKGKWTYTPWAGARHEAATAAGAKEDTFTVTVDDGHGGLTPVNVTVKIQPQNAAPKNAQVAGVSSNPYTGVVTATVVAEEADGDDLTLSGPALSAKKGTVTYDAVARTFTYTPTAAARAASNATKPSTDTFTVTISDGHGGTTTKLVTVTVAPTPALQPGNTAPTNGVVQIDGFDKVIGRVTGTVSASDTDFLSYLLVTPPTKGALQFDTASGTFTYTATATARATASTTPGADTDTFTVVAWDGRGGFLPIEVGVTVTPTAADVVTNIITMGLPVSVRTGPDGTVYVVNNLLKKVSAVDPDNFTVTDINVVTYPQAIAISPDGTKMYVLRARSGSDSQVSVVDIATSVMTSVADVGSNALSMELSTDGSRLYVINSNAANKNVVTVIDTATKTIVGEPVLPTMSRAVTLNSTGSKAYVVGGSEGVSSPLSIVDTATFAVTNVPIDGTSGALYDVAVNADGSRAYVVDFGADRVSVINTADGTKLADIAVGDQPLSIALSPDGTRAYVVSAAEGTMSVINTATNAVIATYTVSNSAWAVTVSSDGTTAYVVDPNGFAHVAVVNLTDISV